MLSEDIDILNKVLGNNNGKNNHADHFNSSNLAKLNTIILLVLGIWLYSVSTEQNRRTLPVKAMEQEMISSINTNDAHNKLLIKL